MHSLGECLFRMGGPLGREAGKASRVLDRTLVLRRRVLGDDHRDTLATMRWAGVAARIGPADKWLDQWFKKKSSKVDLLSLMAADPGSVDQWLKKKGRLFAEAVETGMRKYPNDRETLWAMTDYGGYLIGRGKLDQAKDLLTRCLDRCKTFDDQDPLPVLVRHRLFFTYFFRNDLAGAEVVGKKALKGIRILGKRYPFGTELIANLARVYQMQGRLDKAAPLIDELQASGQSAYALELRGQALLAAKKYAEAEKPLRESMKMNASGPILTLEFYIAQRGLGASLLGQKKYAAAEPLLVKNYETFKKWSEIMRQDPTPLRRLLQVETLKWLVQLYDDWGKPDKAAKWRKELKAVRRLAKGGKP
jgi:tetratricopeptide (TPR) repeat protein